MHLASTRGSVLGLVALAIASLGAIQDSQEINASGLKLQAPKAWKNYPPKNQMRAANLTIPAAEGDKADADLSISVSGGGLAQNIARWEAQFKDASGNAGKAEKKTLKTKSGEATRVELSGIYTDPFGQGGPKPQPDYRMIAAIIEGPQGAYFLKLTGPDKTVKAAAAAFDKFVESSSVAK